MNPDPLLSARAALLFVIAAVAGLVMGFLAWRANPAKISQAVMVGLTAGAGALVGLHSLVGPDLT